MATAAPTQGQSQVPVSASVSTPAEKKKEEGLSLHPLLQPHVSATTKEVALLYNPALETHIGVASVGDADPIRAFTMVCKKVITRKVYGKDGIKDISEATYPEKNLLPGVNLEIEVDFLNHCLHQSEHVRRRFELGAIRIFAPKDDISKADELTDFADEQCNTIVLNTLDVRRLKKWLVADPRPAIRSLLETRIRFLELGESK